MIPLPLWTGTDQGRPPAIILSHFTERRPRVLVSSAATRRGTGTRCPTKCWRTPRSPLYLPLVCQYTSVNHSSVFYVLFPFWWVMKPSVCSVISLFPLGSSLGCCNFVVSFFRYGFSLSLVVFLLTYFLPSGPTFSGTPLPSPMRPKHKDSVDGCYPAVRVSWIHFGCYLCWRSVTHANASQAQVFSSLLVSYSAHVCFQLGCNLSGPPLPTPIASQAQIQSLAAILQCPFFSFPVRVLPFLELFSLLSAFPCTSTFCPAD